MDPRLAFALDVAYRAGRSTLSHFSTGVKVQIKEDHTPVTIADQQAEQLIRKAIQTKYPQDSILGEEGGESGKGTSRWVIDPIDGTKSFISGVPLYATLLSFEVNKEVRIGICYLPALDEMIYAVKGGGAFSNGRLIHVSNKKSLDLASISCGGHVTMMAKNRMTPFLELSKKVLLTRTWGDAYGHVLVATGRIDGMIDPSLHRWDISAMSLIVKEAGGKVTNFAGKEGIFDEAISSNGLIHEQLIEAYRD